MLLVLVAALLGGIVIVQTSSPADAGPVAGGTASGAASGACPSDVNGDLVVNVLDLIDLLLDFGAECPGPQLVGVAVADAPGHDALVRIWSDGFAEYRVTPAGTPGWEPRVWTPLPVNPDAPRSRPIAVTEAGGSSTCPQIYRLWADGTVDHLRLTGDGNMFLFTVEGWITEPN